MGSIKSETLPLFPEIFEENTKKRPHKNITADKKAIAFWEKCLEIIGDNVELTVFNTWFRPIRAYKWDNNTLTVIVPSQFFYEWIEEHYSSLLQKTIYQVLGDDARLQYDVVVDDSDTTLDNRTIRVPAFKGSANSNNNSVATPSFRNETSTRPYRSGLNSQYTLDNFIIGESNQLASSAGRAVSENPGGTRFNPLVVYGDTGLGKTHLIQGIGNSILKRNPKSRVMYTNSETFTMDFINSIQNNKVSEFVNFYRNIDVLIVDDIQFFGGKEKTQDNFFHTFNALHQAGKQLVLSSDKPPRELQDVDDRLISRFQWGLTVDIQQPDLEMRMAILQKKSMDEGIELPPDIIDYLARHVTSSIRSLEGTLISLIAKVTLDKRELSLDTAKEVVYGISALEPKSLTIDDIKDAVSSYYKIQIDMLESKSRKHEIALARQMAMYLAKQLTSMSLKSIGSTFGGRDHSTVLHSCQTIENYLVTDKSVKNACENLLNKLKCE
ncbi:MAG: chromosomal replication initiator protein DnaA [Candidatus Kapaibacterium sp.]